MPISRVRSVTLTSMMFMMPMPPTTNDIPAMAPSIKVMGRGHVVDGVGDFLLIQDIVVVLLSRREPMPLAQQIGDRILRAGHALRAVRPARTANAASCRRSCVSSPWCKE
jgi:hypothetical protein